MVTMKEALAKVDVTQLNEWEKGFYDDQKDANYGF